MICNTVEALTEKKPTGYCQFIYSSEIGVPLLKEGLKYVLDLLNKLDPDNEENCYEKFEYYNKDTVNYCKKVFMDLWNAFNI